MAHRWHYSDWDELRKRQDPVKVMQSIGPGGGLHRSRLPFHAVSSRGRSTLPPIDPFVERGHVGSQVISW
ncbi:MAG TPA: hypothetical protein VMW26_05740 [Methanomassiliicoccales archaeon]|nr:hypothetical protein [Methanomassiliicoccales archaeon]